VSALHHFLCDERGVESVEYAIITGLIVASIVAIILAIGELTYAHFRELGRYLYGATPPPSLIP
jgi:Flp pilus assembly pilin Flp